MPRAEEVVRRAGSASRRVAARSGFSWDPGLPQPGAQSTVTPLARALAAIDQLSDGRLIAGVAPGSSRRDYDLVGIPFEQRWSRFDDALTVLRAELSTPLWVASWGSPAGLRRGPAALDNA